MASVSVSPSKDDVGSMPLSSLKRLTFVSVRPILQQSSNIFHQSGVNAVVLHQRSFTFYHIISPLNVLSMLCMMYCKPHDIERRYAPLHSIFLL